MNVVELNKNCIGKLLYWYKYTHTNWLYLLTTFKLAFDFSNSAVYTVYMNYGFVFSQTDKRPMYKQIMEQIMQRIAIGEWQPNTPLPSIRQLAIEIKVSIITVKRAYLELEREGVIVTQQGKGSFVNDRVDLQSLQQEELNQHLEQAAKLAKSMDLSEDELLNILKKYTR